MDKSQKALDLRGHHLFCILSYEGKGYSKGFVENFDRVFTAAKANPDLEVTVSTSPDPICRACPNLGSDDLCESQERVVKRDRAAMNAVGIANATTHRLQDLLALIRPRYGELLAAHCQGCSWSGICSTKAAKGEFSL